MLADDPHASIQRIADEAGLVRLTVYRRYRNRDELRKAIYEAAAVEVKAAADHARKQDLDTLAALRELIRQMAATARRYPLLLVGEDHQPRPGERHRPSPPVATRAMHRAIFELVKRGQHEGVLRIDLPAELLPLAISGSLRFVLRFAGTLRLDPAEAGDQVATLLLDGYAVAEAAKPSA